MDFQEIDNCRVSMCSSDNRVPSKASQAVESVQPLELSPVTVTVPLPRFNTLYYAWESG